MCVCARHRRDFTEYVNMSWEGTLVTSMNNVLLHFQVLIQWVVHWDFPPLESSPPSPKFGSIGNDW